MAADATFPCATITDSRASLVSFPFQSESSPARSAVPANRSLAAPQLQETKRPQRHQCGYRDPLSTPSRPTGSPTGDRTLSIVCHPPCLGRPNSKYHCLREPRAMSYPRIQSLPERRCTLLLLRRCFPLRSLTLYHAPEVVMHHKTSRPSLRNPRPQLLINPALPRVPSNKPQPCWAHATSPSACARTATIPVGRSAANKQTRRTAGRLGTVYNLYWLKKSFFSRINTAISTGSLIISFRQCRPLDKWDTCTS